jgi:hypothetical protein
MLFTMMESGEISESRIIPHSMMERESVSSI